MFVITYYSYSLVFSYDKSVVPVLLYIISTRYENYIIPIYKGTTDDLV